MIGGLWRDLEAFGRDGFFLRRELSSDSMFFMPHDELLIECTLNSEYFGFQFLYF